ncbi:MAG: phage tail protein, partial [Gemmatimonadota bacterium]
SYAEREVYPKAAARAINRTATTTRKEAVRAIAKHMGVRQKDVRDSTRIHRARPSVSPQAVIEFRGRSLNLIRFKARQIKRGVSAAPWGRRRVFPMAFIANIRGSRAVMVRKKIGGKRVGRLPIRPVRGPGVAKTAADEALARARRETVARVLPERLERELAFYASRLSR